MGKRSGKTKTGKVRKKKYKGRKETFTSFLRAMGLVVKCGLLKKGRLLRKLWSDGNTGEYSAT